MPIHLSKFGQGLPLVCFHGWGFDSQVWLPLIPNLKKHYQLVLVDLPGFGSSAMMDWCDFKVKLIAQLPEKFAVLGWSMGGLYATRLALELPERVNRLINVCSSPRFVAADNWPGVPAQVLEQFYQRLAHDAESTLKDFVALQIKNSPNYVRGQTPSPVALEAGLTTLGRWDLRHELKHLVPPACFLFGKLDPITPLKTMETMQSLYPNFDYHFFSRSAHMPFLSQENEFIKIILGFLQ